MIRYLMKVKRKFSESGLETENFYSVVGESELERCLKLGGYSENSYEYHSLVGVECVEVDAKGGVK